MRAVIVKQRKENEYLLEDNEYLLLFEDDTEYLLEEKNEYQFHFNLTFYDLDWEVSVGDSITFSDELLDREYIEYSTHYRFGGTDSKYGRDIQSCPQDVIVIERADGRRVSLKRWYG